MKKFSKIFSGICCVLTIFLFVFSISIPSKSFNQDNNLGENTNSQTESTITYTLKKYNNSLAVFEDDEVNPTQIIDVDLTVLPTFDQQILAQGIKVSSKKDLKKLIEDYSS